MVWLWLILCGSGPMLAQTPARQANVTFVQRSEEDLLLLSVHLDTLVLTQDLEAYQHPGGILLPLGEVCRLVELGVTVSPSTGTAEGLLFQSGPRFHLNVPAGKASLGGKELPVDPSLVELHRNDIYVDANLLNTWFALGLDIDTHEAAVRIHPREPLPMQKRLERERRAAQARSAFSSYQDPGFPHVGNPYTRFGSPTIDQSLSLNFQPSNGSGGMSIRYTTQVAVDIAHVGLNAFLDVEPGHTSNVAQISLGQRDASGNLLGNLHAREAMLGQVYTQAIPLVSDPHLATGLFISNYPLYHANQFDATTFAGILLPGWDVELYRDQALLDYQGSSSTGRYEFKNVPLTFGSNHYHLVFYGPHGERREENQVFNVGDALIPNGQNWYRCSLQPGLSGDTQYALQDEFGLRRNLSGSVGLATARLSDGIHQYGMVGFRGFLGGLLGYTNLVGDLQTGLAEEIGLQWLWKRTAVEVKQTLVHGLVSQTLSSDVNPIREQTILRLGNIATPRWTHLLPMDLEILQEETRMGLQHWELQNRLSYQGFGLGVTNWLTWRSETGQQSQGQGQLLLNRWGQGRFLQGQMSYNWAPLPQLTQLSLQTERVLHDLRLLTIGIYHTIIDKNYGFTAALTRNIGSYSYGLSADISTKRNLILGVNISLGLLRNPHNGRWDSNAQSQSSHGAVLVRVYQDTNGNGKRDPGEPAIAGVGFFINDMSTPKVTDREGTALIDGMVPFQPADLRVSVATLSNPLWTPGKAGVRIVPRPGVVPIIDFPIVSTGEISGTVYRKDDAGTHEAPGIVLELTDNSGHTLQKQTTAYDGFYTFLRVPVGNYAIQIARTNKESAAFKPTSVPVRIPPEGAFLDGINLIQEDN